MPGEGEGGAIVAAQLVRGPQSWQSVHGVHEPYSEPCPPSSQSPSEWNWQVFMHVPEPGGPGGGGGEGGAGEGWCGGRGGWRAQLPATRGPQSSQSSQGVHWLNSEPGPPSSQSPSEAKTHVLRHSPPPGGAGGGWR